MTNVFDCDTVMGTSQVSLRKLPDGHATTHVLVVGSEPDNSTHIGIAPDEGPAIRDAKVWALKQRVAGEHHATIDFLSGWLG